MIFPEQDEKETFKWESCYVQFNIYGGVSRYVKHKYKQIQFEPFKEVCSQCGFVNWCKPPKRFWSVWRPKDEDEVEKVKEENREDIQEIREEIFCVEEEVKDNA